MKFLILSVSKHLTGLANKRGKGKKKMSIKDFNDRKWKTFIKECKDRVVEDNKLPVYIKSVFLPNPEIYHNPEYCLIAMEPCDSSKKLKELKKNIDNGYRNFIEGYEVLILHYCAYHYLGKKEFNYYITDLSKGSMTSADAHIRPKERYARWQKLLEKEINLLGNPKLIAIGKEVNKVISKTVNNSISSNDYILHYSDRIGSSKARKKECNDIKKKYPRLFNSYCKQFNEKKIEKFVFNKLIKRLGYKRKKEVEKILHEPLKEEEKESLMLLYVLYRHNFETMTKYGRVFRA
jgi:hypothetical protein